jgi:hypothetical protein
LEIGDCDVLRDVRAGLHLLAMHELVPKASNGIRLAAKPAFQAVAALYGARAAKGEGSVEKAVQALDGMILSPAAATAMDTELLMRAVALRLCIAPDAYAPVYPTAGAGRKPA